MDIILLLKALVMGIVEGLTEFLPVSSTGHLILFGQLLRFQGAFAQSFEVMIQLGAILAIIVFYREKILGALGHLGSGGWGRALLLRTLVGIAPAMVLGFLFHDSIKKLFSVEIVGVSLMVGALLLLAGETYAQKGKGSKKESKVDLSQLTLLDALVVGLFQCLSMIPGMSRSGSTITGGLFRNLSAALAAEFSFFLAIPIMMGAFVLEAKDVVIGNASEAMALLVGFLVSFLVAYLVVRVFVAYLGKHSFRVFILYRLGVGALLLLLSLAGTL